MTDLAIEDCSSYVEIERNRIIDDLRSSLIDYNISHLPNTKIEQVLLTIKKQSTFLGWLAGRIAWDWLHIDLLWLDKSIRGKGFGKSIIKQAEMKAIGKHCIGTNLDTFSFQAPDFYTQLGYNIF